MAAGVAKLAWPGCGPVLDADAACRGKWELFDWTGDPATERKALRLCAQCPALPACAAWFDSVPVALRPAGVIAGHVHRPRHRRDRIS